jgi:hypothetical protein
MTTIVRPIQPGGTWWLSVIGPSNTVYVDGAQGDDADPTEYGYKTIQAAMNAAAAGEVLSIAPGTYTEDVTGKDGVHIFGPGVTLRSLTAWAFKPGNGSITVLGTIIASSGDYGVYNLVSGVAAYVHVFLLDVKAGGWGFVNTQTDAPIRLYADRVTVGAAGVAVGHAVSGTGRHDIEFGSIEGDGAAALGLVPVGTGTVDGYVGRFLESVAALTAISMVTGQVRVLTAEINCTNGIVISGAGTARVQATRVNCTTAVSAVAAATARLICTDLAGTVSANGGEIVRAGSGQYAVQNVQFPAAPADTNVRRFKYPQDGCVLKGVWMTSIGGAATAGKVYVKKGLMGAGVTLLNAASVDLNTIANETATSTLALTATAADLEGDKDDWVWVAVENSDASFEVGVVFGNQ